MTDTAPHVALLALGLSLLAVLLMVIVAGASPDAGRLMVVTMVGLWLVWLVRHPTAFSTVARLGGTLS